MLPSLACLAALPALSLSKFVVPLPNGPYGVSIQETLLTDYSRHDPYLNLTYRRVPISIISPTGSSKDCAPVLRQYMPNVTARFWEQGFREDYGIPLNNTLSQTELILCQPKPLNTSTAVILLAPGAGVSRYLYNILGASIVAQTGYTVITYDIPGQTEIVVFPDGSIQKVGPNYAMTYTNDHAVAVVLEDGFVVLDAVFPANGSKANISSSPSLPTALTNTAQAAMIGHSQGGAASLVGLLADTRLSAGVNMDGGLNATADNIAICSNSQSSLKCTTSTTQRSFMILEHDGFNQTKADGWADVWANILQGTKFQVQLNGSQHGTFGDFSYVIDLYGLREQADANISLINSAVGRVPGTEAMEVQAKLLSSFLGYGFDGAAGGPGDNVTAIVGELEDFGLEIVNQTIVN